MKFSEFIEEAKIIFPDGRNSEYERTVELESMVKDYIKNPTNEEKIFLSSNDDIVDNIMKLNGGESNFDTDDKLNLKFYADFHVDDFKENYSVIGERE